MAELNFAAPFQHQIDLTGVPVAQAPIRAGGGMNGAGGVRAAAVIASSARKRVVIGRKHLNFLTQQTPDVAPGMARVSAHRLRRTDSMHPPVASR